MKRTEIFAQLMIVGLTVWYLLFAQQFGHPYISWLEGGWGADFRGYLELARGHAPGHAYKQWLGFSFVPFVKIADHWGEMNALYCFLGLSLVSYMILTHYVCKVRYGWILSLACLKPFWFSLAAGNVSPILCIPLLFLESAWMAVLFKPHLFVVALCVAFAVRASRYHRRPASEGTVGLPDLVHAPLRGLGAENQE